MLGTAFGCEKTPVEERKPSMFCLTSKKDPVLVSRWKGNMYVWNTTHPYPDHYRCGFTDFWTQTAA
jgi:hypothetical protein